MKYCARLIGLERKEGHSVPTAPQTRKSLCVLLPPHLTRLIGNKYLMLERQQQKKRTKNQTPPSNYAFLGRWSVQASLQYGNPLPKKEDHGGAAMAGWTRCEDPACFKQRRLAE